MSRRAVTAAAVLATLLAPAGAAAKAPPRAPLATFDSCRQVVGFADRNAGRALWAWERGMPRIAASWPTTLAPFPRFRPRPGGDPGPAFLPRPVAVQAPASAGEPAGGQTSQTNVQEAGVDEPDVVKADGRLVYALSSGRLLTIDAGAGQERVLGQVRLEGSGHELLVHGTRALVLSRVLRPPVDPAADTAAPYPGGTRLTEVDVTDPAAPRVVRTQNVEGEYVTARLHDGSARVVVVASPDALAAGDGSQDWQRPAGWLPRTALKAPGRAARAYRLLAPCDEVARPQRFSGLDAVTVLTVDLEQGLPAVDADVVLGSAHTVYASDRSLYIATQQVSSPDAEAPPSTTAIHRFDITDRRATTYRSTGTVTGTLLNQFSLSEDDGVLRAATTQQPLWFSGGMTVLQSQSQVTTLAERAGRLEQIGIVGGLGRGERIYAVRFIGDVGYVVTFRQTDPLYTIDLADPARPRVVGELKIPGFSSYLHPVGDDLLLGVGQDATETGRRLGLQLSLFDVADLRAPKRLAQMGLGSFATSVAEQDHHALLHWPASRLAVLPVTAYGSTGADSFFGAVGVGVGRAEGIAERGRIEHRIGEQTWDVLRSLVVAGRLVTVSGEGIEIGALDTLAEHAYVPFPPG
jgi:uncharacterized secreted protein with C-terminal beta-propeller domain